MGTGPHLGGGPVFGTGPDPAGRSPRGRVSATASVHGGISSPSVDARWGPRSADSPSGVLPLTGYFRLMPECDHVGPGSHARVRCLGTTQEGVTGFDFGS